MLCQPFPVPVLKSERPAEFAPTPGCSACVHSVACRRRPDIDAGETQRGKKARGALKGKGDQGKTKDRVCFYCVKQGHFQS